MVLAQMQEICFATMGSKVASSKYRRKKGVGGKRERRHVQKAPLTRNHNTLP